jgi:hypothetical protein
MVVDLTNNDVYIGNVNGNLALISTGSSSGNNVPAGGAGEIQFNAGGNLFGASANLTFVSDILTSNNISTANIINSGSGNITVTGNLIPNDGYTLGLPTVPWGDAFFGPTSSTILDQAGNTATSVTLSTDTGNSIISAGGFIILGNGIPVFRVAALTGQVYSNAQTIIQNTTQSANVTSGSLQTAGGAGIAKNLYVGGNLITTGNTTLNGNVAVAAGKTLTVGGDNVVTSTNHEFEPFFTDASGTFAGATARGSYTMHGDLCYFRINIDFATCTNFGTGQYQVTLPFKSITTMTQRSGTLHQTTGDVRYHIAGIVDLESHTANPGDTMFLYYSRGETDLAYTRTTPVGATTTTSHFDIWGWYQVA